MTNGKRDKIVISVGGSLVVPQTGVDTDFVSKLNRFVRDQLAKHPNRQFFLVIGGGLTARHYRDAAKTVVGHDLTPEDMDWLGIHATRMNAQLIRTVFQDIAHQNVVRNYDIIRKPTEGVVVAAGWKPGWSTDFCSVLVCEDYGVKRVINMSNVTQVYDKDPKVNNDAKPIERISWSEFRALIGDTWTPGLHAPFDPVAAKKAQELEISVAVVGRDFDNVENYIEGKDFLGTVIE